MFELSMGLSLFLIPFMIHIIFWRFTPIRRDPKRLVLVLAGSQVLLLFFLIMTRDYVALTDVPISRWTHAWFVSVSLLLAYVLTYPGIESDSPSNLILIFVRRQEHARTVELEKLFAEKALVEDRINNLIRDKKITVENDRLTLTKSGETFLCFFRRVRSAFTKEPIGG